jgi:hypothetical protein
MKSLFLIVAFIANTLAIKAQTKEETIKYIDSLYKTTFTFGRITVTSVTCQKNLLVKTFSDNDTAKTNLLDIKKLQLEQHYTGTKWHITYISNTAGNKSEYVLGHIGSEADAQKLKTALERLIAWVQKEKR